MKDDENWKYICTFLPLPLLYYLLYFEINSMFFCQPYFWPVFIVSVVSWIAVVTWTFLSYQNDLRDYDFVSFAYDIPARLLNSDDYSLYIFIFLCLWILCLLKIIHLVAIFIGLSVWVCCYFFGMFGILSYYKFIGG